MLTILSLIPCEAREREAKVPRWQNVQGVGVTSFAVFCGDEILAEECCLIMFLQGYILLVATGNSSKHYCLSFSEIMQVVTMCIVRRFLDRNLRNIVPSNSSLSSLVNVFQPEYCVVVLGIVTPHQTVLPLTNHQSGRDNWSSPPINKFTIYFSLHF